MKIDRLNQWLNHNATEVNGQLEASSDNMPPKNGASAPAMETALADTLPIPIPRRHAVRLRPGDPDAFGVPGRRAPFSSRDRRASPTSSGRRAFEDAQSGRASTTAGIRRAGRAPTRTQGDSTS